MPSSTQFQLLAPAERIEEVRWVAEFILGEYLGLSHRVQAEPGLGSFRLESEGKALSLPDEFFARATENWLGAETLPSEPIRIWKLADGPLARAGVSELPLLHGHGGFEMSPGGDARLALDVFGFCFFMLSRYEEVAAPVRDRYGRFPSTGAIARRQRFLQEPVVDHYVEILYAAMQAVWPGLERSKRKGAVVVSCDVDEPYERWIRNRRWLAVGVAGALVARRSLTAARNRIANYRKSLQGDYTKDKSWTFNWYLDTCERAGRSATFYFFGRVTGALIDAVYDLRERRISELLRTMDRRGHRIGLHGSFSSYNSAEILTRERTNLQAVCSDLGITGDISANRQHYLRFEAETTPQCLEAAGFATDSSGGYAEFAGFRFGTSRSFRMWSFAHGRSLNLRQLPLVVMDCAVVDLMGLGYTEAAYATAEGLKKKAMRFGGDFSLLWHNSHLTSEDDRAMFSYLLR
jgi:hypothetical protein